MSNKKYTKEQVKEIVREIWGWDEYRVLPNIVLFSTVFFFQIYLSEQNKEILYETRVNGNFAGLETTLNWIDENWDKYNLGGQRVLTPLEETDE